MNNAYAITRTPGQSMAACELTFLSREPIDPDLACTQHSKYCDALRNAGFTVEVLPPEPGLPDACFVEDTAIVIDELAVMTRPGVAIRRREVPSVAMALGKHRMLEWIREPGTLDGGDVLRVGKQFFIGISARTNAEGFRQLAEIVERHGYRATALKATGCLHLKSAVTALDKGTLLVNDKWIEVGTLAGFNCILVPEEEPFAANALALNGVIHMSARFVRTREMLDRLGYRTTGLDVSEFEKAEAALTCLSLILD